MASSTYVDKVEVVAMLRSKELHGRADWVDREMPAFIDTLKNASLLSTLGIDVGAMSSQTPPGTTSAERSRDESSVGTEPEGDALAR